MDLKEIIIKAIPSESCPVKNANAMHRRQVLEKRIKAYIEEKLADVRPIGNENSNGVGESLNRLERVQEM